ncbi:MAG TPA: S53 family peptidase [Terracidiphilus sp.]|nr:S53 family peptidase [Terracidiphilus sp.]
MHHFPLSGAALLLAAALIPAADAQTTWVKTSTQGVTAVQLDRATDLGPVNGDQAITVRVGLPMQNKAALEAYVKSVNDPSNPMYGQSLTPAQFVATYGATPAQVSAVTNYLKSAGFTNIVAEPNHLLVSADGTVAQANAAFHTTIESFNQYGAEVHGNLTAAEVPQSLAGDVSAVLGLNTIGQMRPTLVTRTQVATPQYAVSYSPQDFWKIYGATGLPPAANATIAIMAEGNLTQVLKDLRTAEAAFKLPQVAYTVVPVGIASADTSGADEWDLDTQYSTGMAGSVKHLYIYDTTSLTDSDLALEISRWATQDVAKAGSASLGECEIFPFLDGSMLVDDESFLEAAAQGQTFFASTGDTGSFCPVGVGTNGVPAGVPLANYPAASAYVVGVGGTTLLAASGDAYDQEVAWYAGGGGISQFEYCPYWQSAAGVVSCENNSKGLPDVSMDADPYSGANVYVDGAVVIVGGTSLSSPLALGTWARMISSNTKLGFAAPHLYGLYNGAVHPGAYPKGGFHDIIAGANGLYSALPGWDYTTGLGTFWINEMYADIK